MLGEALAPRLEGLGYEDLGYEDLGYESLGYGGVSAA
jgi:hypothetical protein